MQDTRSSKEPLIIHHTGCSDGICGALVLWLGLGRRGELLPAQYGDDPPKDEVVRDREVWIVDFSYPRETLEHLNTVAHNLLVLDHHKSAAENCAGLDYCMFDSTRSGAKIAFDFMLNLGGLRQQPPRLVDALGVLAAYVQDRDLWTWELDHSKEMSAWLASHPRDLQVWFDLLRKLAQHGFVFAASEGSAILRNNDRLVAAMAYGAEDVSFLPADGPSLRVLLVNASTLQSDVASKLLDDRDCDFVCVWRRIPDKFLYSLRSNTTDVAEVAKGFGGGGHARAAGFSSPSRPARFFLPGWEVKA